MKEIKKINECFEDNLNKYTTSKSFEHIWERYSHSEKYSSLSRKVIVPVILLLVLIIPITGFAYYKFIWLNTQILIRDEKQDLSDVHTPLEMYDKIINETDYKYINREKAYAAAGFPIRIIDGVDGWHKLKSIGVYMGKETVATDGKTSISNGPLSYWEIYNNSANEKVIVIQELVAHMDSKISYPKDSKILNSYAGDLAVLTDLKKGRKVLYTYHKEINGNITKISIFSNANETTMENFAQKYLKLKINKR